MNCPGHHQATVQRRARARQAGFSLPEFMVTAGVFLIVVGGILSAHVFGLRMIQFAEMSSQISQSDRVLLQQLSGEMAEAKSFKLGSGSASSFSALGVNRLQSANALQIYTGTGTNQYVRYYLSTSQDKLYRVSSQSGTAEMVADSIINSLIFSAEDHQGHTLSNNTQGAILNLNIHFQDAPKRTYGLSQKAVTHWLKAKYRVRATD